jgi:hypothetical protein
METANVSAIPAPPPAAARLHASRTRVQNQRRTTWPVTGFCDRRAHETAARLRPRLHHRPATPPPGRRPPTRRLLPGVHRDRQRRPHRPSDAQRALLNGSLHRPLDPAAHQLLDPGRSPSPWADLPDDRLRRRRRPGEAAGSSLVGRNRLRRHVGAACLRRPAAGRTPAWSRSPSSPQVLRVGRHRAVRSDGEGDRRR